MRAHISLDICVPHAGHKKCLADMCARTIRQQKKHAPLCASAQPARGHFPAVTASCCGEFVWCGNPRAADNGICAAARATHSNKVYRRAVWIDRQPVWIGYAHSCVDSNKDVVWTHSLTVVQ